jgi:HSP20 family protein
MFVKQWQPFGNLWSEMSRVQDQLEAACGQPRHASCSHSTPSYPPLNVWGNDDNLYVEAELPGLDQDNLEIYVDRGNQLTIKGQRHAPEHDQVTWYRRERSFGEFTRVVELSEDVDPDKVSAEFKQGVLTILLPKKEEVKPRRIKVTTE